MTRQLNKIFGGVDKLDGALKWGVEKNECIGVFLHAQAIFGYLKPLRGLLGLVSRFLIGFGASYCTFRVNPKEFEGCSEGYFRDKGYRYGGQKTDTVLKPFINKALQAMSRG